MLCQTVSLWQPVPRARSSAVPTVNVVSASHDFVIACGSSGDVSRQR